MKVWGLSENNARRGPEKCGHKQYSDCHSRQWNLHQVRMGGIDRLLESDSQMCLQHWQVIGFMRVFNQVRRRVWNAVLRYVFAVKSWCNVHFLVISRSRA